MEIWGGLEMSLEKQGDDQVIVQVESFNKELENFWKDIKGC